MVSSDYASLNNRHLPYQLPGRGNFKLRNFNAGKPHLTPAHFISTDAQLIQPAASGLTRARSFDPAVGLRLTANSFHRFQSNSSLPWAKKLIFLPSAGPESEKKAGQRNHNRCLERVWWQRPWHLGPQLCDHLALRGRDLQSA